MSLWVQRWYEQGVLKETIKKRNVCGFGHWTTCHDDSVDSISIVKQLQIGFCVFIGRLCVPQAFFFPKESLTPHQFWDCRLSQLSGWRPPVPHPALGIKWKGATENSEINISTVLFNWHHFVSVVAFLGAFAVSSLQITCTLFYCALMQASFSSFIKAGHNCIHPKNDVIFAL